MRQSRPARATRFHLARALVGTLAAVALLSLLCVGFVAVNVHTACGCTSTPTPYAGPTPTPLPVSAGQAAAAARPFTSVAVAAADWAAAPESPIYELAAEDSYAFVDGETGRVLEVFELDRMPGSDAVPITPASAQAAAASYLERAGVKAVASDGSVTLRQRASIAFYDVRWAKTANSAIPQVLVNPATGSVFAYNDLGFAPTAKLEPPVIGSAVAATLAGSSVLSHGQTADFGPEFQLDASRPSWMIGFNDGVLSVDAATGEVSVLKWASSR